MCAQTIQANAVACNAMEYRTLSSLESRRQASARTGVVAHQTHGSRPASLDLSEGFVSGPATPAGTSLVGNAARSIRADQEAALVVLAEPR